ncbi:MAG: N-acetylglucosamine-6-phosphate deacetylase [Actinomycetota bacterium]
MISLIAATVPGSHGPTTVTFDGGSITSVGGSAAGEKIDCSGLLVAPGLIDLQTNGAYGADFTTDPSTLWSVGRRLPERGVTAFLPTIITSPPGQIEAAIEALDARPSGYRGAEPLGLHLEGPMLSPGKPGVHDPALLRLPSIELIDGWTPENGVALVTLAPELPGAEQVVKTLVGGGVVVAAGHSAADYEEAVAGFGWGITAITHLFNAMEPFRHRAPGLVGAAFDSDVVAGIICDGVHVHPAAVRVAWRVLGPDHVALVTDSMAATGLQDGTYQLGGASISVRDGRAEDSSHRLAGSTLTLDQAVRNLITLTGCSPAEALAAASTVPARLLRLEDRGAIKPGARADLVLFDRAMELAATIVAGEFVWRR